MASEHTYVKIHPELEISREKIIKLLFSRVFDICSDIKPDFKRRDKTDGIMTRFCWKNISSSTPDPVIPYHTNGKYDTKQLSIDLKNMGIDDKIVLKKLNIKKFLSTAIKTFDDFYNSLGDNIIIKDNGNELIYEQNRISYARPVMESMNKFYNGDKKNKLATFFCALYRYNLMGGDNQQLSVIPQFKEDLRKHFDINTELFGSCINRYYDNYCSIYYDIEKYFGSLGDFFDLPLNKGLYFSNPPFDETIMEKMAIKMIESLDKSDEPLGFIVILPVWNFDSIKNLGALCHTYIGENMGKFEAYELLIHSKHYFKHFTFCKNNFKYYNFAKNQYINASNTHIIIVKNDKLTIDISKFEQLLRDSRLMHI